MEIEMMMELMIEMRIIEMMMMMMMMPYICINFLNIQRRIYSSFLMFYFNS